MSDLAAELPNYPALARCILVDARHGSRVELAKDLRASLLFEQIFEAQSLSGALSTLEFEEMDACFLGPSVTFEKAAEFLRRAKAKVRSKDIAFISVLNRLDESNHDRYLEAGVHGVVLRPCTKMKLSDWVIRAVVAANGNGAWASIFKASGHDQLDIPDVFKKKEAETAPPAAEIPVVTKPTPPPVVAEEARPVEEVMFAAILKAASAELRGVVQGIESGEFRLDPSGNPTPRAREAIEKLVAGVIASNEAASGDAESAHFGEFFRLALLQWFIDIIHTDEKEATLSLRKRLLTYVPLGKSG